MRALAKRMTNVTVKCPKCGFTARRKKDGPSWRNTAPATCPKDGIAMVNPNYRSGDAVGLKGNGRRL